MFIEREKISLSLNKRKTEVMVIINKWFTSKCTIKDQSIKLEQTLN